MEYQKYKSPSFMEAYKMAFVNFLNIEDRSRRSEYWKFATLSFLINILVIIISVVISDSNGSKFDSLLIILCGAVVLVHSLAGLALAARRLHDVGRSAKWIILAYIPVLGNIIGLVVLFWLFCDSNKDDNEWGASPKYYIED